MSVLPPGRFSGFLLDAGPLVAVLNRRDQHHDWALRTLDALDAPLLTCEPVLSEAWFLVRRGGGSPERLLDLVQALDLDVRPTWTDRTRHHLRRWAGRASLADAALLSLAEERPRCVVVTTDRVDFSVYRIRRRESVAILTP